MALIAIVDENDAVVGSVEREERAPEQIYRVSALWLTNSKGEILMAQRALTKKHDPGVWGPAVAGTVEAHETYKSNIVKEIQEEIGLVVEEGELSDGPRVRIHKPQGGYFAQYFLLTKDILVEDFVLEKDGVAQVKWFSKDELRDMLANHPEQLTPAAGQWMPQFLN
ncbi:MAG: hypothetical protein RLZZ342_581 [Candidatus Parcubacteria bacterium]|jgi:isopentenyl-diphosphate delta-isomerase